MGKRYLVLNPHIFASEDVLKKIENWINQNSIKLHGESSIKDEEKRRKC